ncbi:phenylalanine--tRNA ligase alpha subunit [Anaeramoeba flamelloides]|uniref:Phenylalanine--tRNA ligase alpha subunit n=1 Tax=Anaeramoeba flamelloides TaxID=1746091 RepID=A0ABQ8X4W8_9EUKA|nr:phenylalanine--tRNA ligase alpha subunit [Anaeramoeba flamelloides]
MEPHTTIFESLKKGSFNTRTFSKLHSIDYSYLVTIVKWYRRREAMNIEQVEYLKASLTQEGSLCLKLGSPEVRMFEMIPKEGIQKSILMKEFGNLGNNIFGQCMKRGWIKSQKISEHLVEKTQQLGNEKKKKCRKKKAKLRPDLLLFPKVDTVEDKVKDILELIKKNETYPDTKIIIDLRKRKLIETQTIKSLKVEKGKNFSLFFHNLNSKPSLTIEMLKKGDWKNVQFQKYDFKRKGKIPKMVTLHPIKIIQNCSREVFLWMGFDEILCGGFFTQLKKKGDKQMDLNGYNSFKENIKVMEQENIKEQKPEKHFEEKEIIRENVNQFQKSDSQDQIDTKSIVLNSNFELPNMSEFTILNRPRKSTYQAFWTSQSFELIDQTINGRKKKKSKMKNTLPAGKIIEQHTIEAILFKNGISLQYLMSTVSDFCNRLGISNFKFFPMACENYQVAFRIVAYFKKTINGIKIGQAGILTDKKFNGLKRDLKIKNLTENQDFDIKCGHINFSLDNLSLIYNHLKNNEPIKNSVNYRFDPRNTGIRRMFQKSSINNKKNKKNEN